MTKSVAPWAWSTAEENIPTSLNIINIDSSWTRSIGFICKISNGKTPRLEFINPEPKWESDFLSSCCDLKQELRPRILHSIHERSTINRISLEIVIWLSEQLSCSRLDYKFYKHQDDGNLLQMGHSCAKTDSCTADLQCCFLPPSWFIIFFAYLSHINNEAHQTIFC